MGYNSRIKQIRGQCIDCVVKGDKGVKVLTANRCPYHYAKHRVAENNAKRESRGQKTTKGNSSIIPVKRIITKDDLLDEWFKERELVLAEHPYCWECGDGIFPDFYRHAIAHIFPKAKFPSVKTADLNYIFLGAGCGCHDKTHKLSTFSKMRVWPLAVERFRTFEPLITETHKYLSLFKSYIK